MGSQGIVLSLNQARHCKLLQQSWHMIGRIAKVHLVVSRMLSDSYCGSTVYNDTLGSVIAQSLGSVLVFVLRP